MHCINTYKILFAAAAAAAASTRKYRCQIIDKISNMNIKQCLNTKRNAIDSGQCRIGENFSAFASAINPGINCKLCSMVDLNKEFYYTCTCQRFSRIYTMIFIQFTCQNVT